MPHQTEEEEDSGNDLDDVEKFLNEHDVSDMVLVRDEVREVLASRNCVEGLDDHRNQLQTLQRGSCVQKLRS